MTSTPLEPKMPNLGKLTVTGGQWDEDGNAILHVLTGQKIVGMAQVKALQAILDAHPVQSAAPDGLQEAAAQCAEWAHMLPPDGGSPSEEEKAVADEAAKRIRALSAEAVVGEAK